MWGEPGSSLPGTQVPCRGSAPTLHQPVVAAMSLADSVPRKGHMWSQFILTKSRKIFTARAYSIDRKINIRETQICHPGRQH